MSNETFAENSWYFRNALLRANCNDLQNGIHSTTKFLEMFFENLLMDAGHELNNRYMQEKELVKFYSKNGIGMGSCLTTFIQFPVMICLYNAIRHITAIECGTIILPWISSLQMKDPFFVLPIATIIVQTLPQLYPYLRIFATLNIQKQTGSMLISMIIMNSIFVFMIPSGIGIYYFVSGLFQSVEQFIYNIICTRKAAIKLPAVE